MGRWVGALVAIAVVTVLIQNVRLRARIEELEWAR